MKLYFIACPYSDPDPKIVEQRFYECTKIATELSLRGIAVYSQITMTHPINKLIKSEFPEQKIVWTEIDKTFMQKCDELIVLELDGWETSGGVKNEIQFFKDNHKKVWMYQDFIKAIQHKFTK